MRVALVTGATGVVGRRLLPALIEAGWYVHALVRSATDIDLVAGDGVQPFIGDVLDSNALTTAATGATAVLHFATAIPRDRSGADAWRRNDQIRVRGTQAVITAARAAGVQRLVSQSVTYVYGDHADELITESTPIGSDLPPFLDSAVALEALTLHASDLSPVVVRGGVLFGEATGTTERLLKDAKSGHLSVDGDGRHYQSLITPTDLAGATVVSLERAAAGAILNAVDDKPVRQFELYHYLARITGGPVPALGCYSARGRSIRCSNVALRQLGFDPQFPSYTQVVSQLPEPASN